MMKAVKKKIANLLYKFTGINKQKCLETIIRPKGGQAHLCSTIAFLIAKKDNKNPSEVASDLYKKLERKIPQELKVQVNGPYINFYFTSVFFYKELNSKLAFRKKRKKILIEYPSVNPNKPWHVGHLRNALLGDCLANLLELIGYQVLRLDYIDDLGLQVAQSYWGYKNLTQEIKAYKNKFDHIVGRQYVEVAKKFSQPEVEKEVRQILQQMENGKEPISTEVKNFVYKVLEEQYKTAYTLNIYHDLIVFESDIIRCIYKEGLKKIKESGILVYESEGKNAGCWVIKLSKEKEFENMQQPDKVIIRSDGTATYIAKDIAFHLWKLGAIDDKFLYKEFQTQPNNKKVFMTSVEGEKKNFGAADIVINVIGSEQAYLQNTIAYALKKLGYGEKERNYIHLAYEHVVLPEGRFSGREGTWIGKEGEIGYSADELLDEVINTAFNSIKKEYEEGKKKQIANATAKNALKFWFLKTAPLQKIIFDFQKALSLEGDSGPYVQYSYIRAKNIVAKANIKSKIDKNYIPNDSEEAILLEMAYFEEEIEKCAFNYQVHGICDYALRLAEKFNKFYEKCPVNSADFPKTRKYRLAIVKHYCKIMQRIFNIFGFVDLEEM
ncbi:MAG: arginine--tRNA ligase [Candidatus Anstonellaceae archaeon]